MRNVMMMVLVGFSVSTFAQKPPPSLSAEPPQDERMNAARALAKLTVSPEQHQKTMASVASVVANKLRAEGDDRPDLDKRVLDAMLEILPYQDQLDLQTSLLVKYYTVDELKDLTTFYSSPTGKKSLQIMPELMGDVMAVTTERMQRAMPAAMKKLQSERTEPKDVEKPVSGGVKKKK